MVTSNRLARLMTLQHTLGAAVGIVREVDRSRLLARLEEEDPGRWTPLADALSLTMEQADGTLAAALTALAAALED